MIDSIDLSLVNWSRGQFALTAFYHWLFVPLTLGITFIIAIMETIYVRTGNEEWKKITKFWMTLFGINFAIGVATGIILEFEFGTNWSNYSWFVGDIFGAPLAIEGIMAFFLESTFIAVMFFGWNKVSKKFHLLSTWMVAFGASLSALWILVANAWMQYPVGMHFNPDTARNEMIRFWDVLFSPVAVNKFLHTIASGYVLASVFVTGVSAWFLLRKRNILFAKRSITVASIFGLLASIYVVGTGDGSTRQLAKIQPMKLAAIEGLYEGKEGTGLVVIGILSDSKQGQDNIKDFNVRIEIPGLLSYMAYGQWDAFVPGIIDLIKGHEEEGIVSAAEKIERGNYARDILRDLKEAESKHDMERYESLRVTFMDEQFQNDYFKYFGYGFIDDPSQLIPNVPLSFYSFHFMVGLGFYFLIFFILALLFVYTGKLERRRGFLRLALFTIPLAYLATMAGWTVAEMGRQPWVIQDLMPTFAAGSRIDASAVQVTFWLFLIIFTALLIAEIKIMTKQIKIGPNDGGN
ncbi:MAG: cytochrome C oxidase subunit II [Bacteroides sp. SM23_62_1]|nr:MAG: cytochrome C oxidase subunit II [Bacteroides sp. SM23_62_1]